MTTISLPTATSLDRWQFRYFTIWATQALSQIGSHIAQFALIWWITNVVGSASALALASMMGLLPQVLLGPFAGALVDRWNRKRVMIVADAISMACVMVLAYLFATGQAQIWHAYALMFVRSCCGAFQGNAMQASTALLVPQTHLARVAGFNPMLQGGTSIVAPIIAALLLVWLPLQGMLMIDVITALPAIAVLMIFIIPQPVRDQNSQQSMVPNHMQGRVMSLVGSACMLMSPISLAVSGPLSDVIGLRTWYVVGGLACILMAGLAALTPAVMNIEAGNNAGNHADRETGREVSS